MNEANSGPRGLTYFATLLTDREVEEWTKWVGQLVFEHQVARGRPMKRGDAMFGYAYVTAGRRLEPAKPFPACLAALATRIATVCPPGTEFNQCIVTKYPPDAGIGWHTDAPSFRDCIAGVSLGGDAQFLFRRKAETAIGHRLPVAAGSLYVMTGSARWEYQHSVKPVKTTRYSLTLRFVWGVDRMTQGE
ncbi:MAG: alpha-ketoglutarate-dependent dioxygenase AlkB [Vicinamibacterales bacterium]